VRGGASDLTRDTVVMYLRRCFQYQYGVSVTRGPWRQHASCLHDHAAWQRNIAILASCSTAAMAMLWHMAVRMASRYQAALRPPPPRPARPTYGTWTCKPQLSGETIRTVYATYT